MSDSKTQQIVICDASEWKQSVFLLESDLGDAFKVISHRRHTSSSAGTSIVCSKLTSFWSSWGP